MLWRGQTLLYASNVAEVMRISTDMLTMIIVNNFIDVAYGLLVTIDRLKPILKTIIGLVAKGVLLARESS